MWKKLSVPLIPTVLFVTQPLQVLAQQSQSPNTPPPPQWYGPGPWHMWAVWVWMAFLVDGPGNDAVHDPYLRCCRLPPLQPSLRRLAPNGSMDRQWDTSYSALGILDKRYARGEIQKEEYQERKAAILLVGCVDRNRERFLGVR